MLTLYTTTIYSLFNLFALIFVKYIISYHYSYKDKYTIIPILVGSLNVEQEALYGRILMPYLADPANLFVISSDFCHWGNRFNYTYYEKSAGPIDKSIEKLDKEVSKDYYFFLYRFKYSDIYNCLFGFCRE